MSKHTPGPWTAIIEKDGEHVVDTYVVDVDEDVVVRPSAKLSEPDARLIAAAPDLLAALRALITEWDRPREIPADPDWCDAIVGQARAAIAKAEGTS